jgi:hypothetical protein
MYVIKKTNERQTNLFDETLKQCRQQQSLTIANTTMTTMGPAAALSFLDSLKFIFNTSGWLIVTSALIRKLVC